jgi:aminocarboxymuconate-semialdehyde decarboxylase
MTIIDIHAHLVPQSFPPPPPGVPERGWPTMVPLPDGTARMMIDGAEFRIFEPAYWDIAGRIAYMDREGISIQVLSPLPELLGYWLDPATTAALADHTNRTIADGVASARGRLAGLGMLPLQDLERSLEGIGAAAQLGLRGFLVASNVNGKSIADPSFDPLFAELARRGMVLLVHGYRPAGTERLLGSPLMAPIVGVPQDCAAAIASFIATDVLGRHPEFKLGFAHGGGAFGAVLDRFDHVWHAFPALQKTSPVAPRDYVRRFFFDTVTFSTAYLTYLVEAFGADTLMSGSDGPTPIGQTGLAGFVTTACRGDAATAEKILWRNAARFLDLSIPAA